MLNRTNIKSREMNFMGNMGKIFFGWLLKPGKKEIKSSAAKIMDKDFLKYKSIWEESSGLNLPKVPDTQQEWVKLQRTIRNIDGVKGKTSIISRLIPSPKLAIAYSFIAIVLISITFFVYNQTEPIIYETAFKEHEKVTLDDGSIVDLNAGSKLTVSGDFNSDTRIVTLQGEAYFKVKKNNKPFTVITGSGIVNVEGTEFNVKSRNEKMVVAVNKGIVRVSSIATSQDSSIILTKGQRTFCSAGAYPSPAEVISTESNPDWLYSKITLNKEQLKYVFEEIERRFDLKISYEDRSIGDVKISGLYNTSDLNSLMSSLCVLIDKNFKHENDSIYIY